MAGEWNNPDSCIPSPYTFLQNSVDRQPEATRRLTISFNPGARGELNFFFLVGRRKSKLQANSNCSCVLPRQSTWNPTTKHLTSSHAKGRRPKGLTFKSYPFLNLDTLHTLHTALCTLHLHSLSLYLSVHQIRNKHV